MSTNQRARLVQAIQLIVGGALLLWLFRDVRLESVLAHLGQLSASTVVSLLAVTITGLACRFYMWHSILVHLEPTGYDVAPRVDLILNFVNQLTPSRLSGRALGPLVVRHYTDMSWSDAVGATGVHTALYAILYGAAGAIGLGVIFTELPPGVTIVVSLSVALYLILGVLVLLGGVKMEALIGLAGLFERLGQRVPVGGEQLVTVAGALPTFTADSARVFRSLSTDWTTVAGYSIGWIGGMLLAPGLRILLLLSAFGASFEPAILLPFLLVCAYSVTVLPITPGGIGVTEATATLVLVVAGVPYDVVVPVVLVDRSLGVYLPALSGWIPAVRINYTEYLLE